MILENRELNREALLDTIYTIQTDLKILTERLARERHVDLSHLAIVDLAYLQVTL